MKEEDKKPMYLSEKERNLIELIRKVGFGEIRIVVNEGVPTQASFFFLAELHTKVSGGKPLAIYWPGSRLEMKVVINKGTYLFRLP